jgi:hypothetical protein
MQSILEQRKNHPAGTKIQLVQSSIHKSFINLLLPPLHHHHHRQSVQLTVAQQGLLDL